MASRTYKAKRKNWRELPKENQWVYGAIFKGKENSYIITNVKVTDEWEDSEIGADVIGYLVDPETICQDTGLTDKNGRKIFDGYICRDSDNIVRILWNDKHQWGVEISKTDNALSRGLAFPLWQYDNCKENGYRKLEVIGNIFDNLGLLEGGEAE